jgi:hypothetical protein
MKALMVIEVKIPVDADSGFSRRLVIVQVDLLIF